MKISTKGRYALRLMLDLAINNTGEYIPIKRIAERQEISEKYLEQIITQISRAGFVQRSWFSGRLSVGQSPGRLYRGDDCAVVGR